MGKSFALGAALRLLGKRAGGFATVFGQDGDGARCLYIQPWGEKYLFEPERIAARETAGAWKADTETFDKFGVQCLRRASESAEIIVMDELGFLEKDAELFRKAVLETLKAGIPVLGVIRQGMPGWTGQAAGQGRVIEVTEDNRDKIPEMISEMLK